MAGQTLELLPDGTALTDEVVNALVADVYAALEQGAYRSIPNPHGKPPLRKIADPRLRAKLQGLVAAI